MNRLLEDADASMMVLFIKRTEHLNLNEGQLYKRIQEFKDYLKDEFQMSNFLIERYINEEFRENTRLELNKMDRIICKYTSKFKMTKRERKAHF
jgi:hypothetical protein